MRWTQLEQNRPVSVTRPLKFNPNRFPFLYVHCVWHTHTTQPGRQK